MKRNLLLLSTSAIHGSGYLDYCSEPVQRFFEAAEQMLFIPYARPSGITHDQYTDLARKKFESWGKPLKGIHEYDDPKAAVAEAQGLFIGGGNTFLLLTQLYKHDLVTAIREKVAAGMPYMGSSAGTNMAGKTIGTTNDMPIIYPPSFDALQLVPFNINPHYMDPDPNSTHRGETRETRIKEFHFINTQPVVGLREGSWLEVRDQSVQLGGTLQARLFRSGKDPQEFHPNSDLSFLL